MAFLQVPQLFMKHDENKKVHRFVKKTNKGGGTS